MKRQTSGGLSPAGRRGARRRVRTRTALFLCMAAMAGTLLTGLLGRMTPPAVRVWLGAAASVAFFALPAYLGLCELDGDQRRLMPVRRLSGGQTLWLAASGALFVCPATLLGDIAAAIALRFAPLPGAQAAVQGADGASLLMPTLLASGFIAPVCEEVFFRGYLLGVFARQGRLPACVMTALLFAAVHGLGVNTLVYALLGLALAAVVLRTGSVFAAVLVHMAYNATLVLLSATPLAFLFVGLTPAGCAVRLLGCAALVFTARRAWLARGAREGKPQALSLTRREAALLAAALLLVIAAQVTAVWAAGGQA